MEMCPRILLNNTARGLLSLLMLAVFLCPVPDQICLEGAALAEQSCGAGHTPYFIQRGLAAAPLWDFSCDMTWYPAWDKGAYRGSVGAAFIRFHLNAFLYFYSFLDPLIITPISPFLGHHSVFPFPFFCRWIVVVPSSRNFLVWLLWNFPAFHLFQRKRMCSEKLHMQVLYVPKIGCTWCSLAYRQERLVMLNTHGNWFHPSFLGNLGNLKEIITDKGIQYIQSISSLLIQTEQVLWQKYLLHFTL